MDSAISEREMYSKLSAFGQQHIVHFLQSVASEEKEALLRDLQTIDFQQTSKLYQLYLSTHQTKQEEKVFQEAEVLSFYEKADNHPAKKALYNLGEDYLREGKVGIMLVAGGQGTRLGFKGPKGCYPVSPVKAKSLFQLFSETILALQRRYGKNLRLTGVRGTLQRVCEILQRHRAESSSWVASLIELCGNDEPLLLWQDDVAVVVKLECDRLTAGRRPTGRARASLYQPFGRDSSEEGRRSRRNLYDRQPQLSAGYGPTALTSGCWTAIQIRHRRCSAVSR